MLSRIMSLQYSQLGDNVRSCHRAGKQNKSDNDLTKTAVSSLIVQLRNSSIGGSFTIVFQRRVARHVISMSPYPSPLESPAGPTRRPISSRVTHIPAMYVGRNHPTALYDSFTSWRAGLDSLPIAAFQSHRSVLIIGRIDPDDISKPSGSVNNTIGRVNIYTGVG